MDIYLLPGLGADRRVFARLDLGANPVTYLDWPSMPPGSTLPDYAVALATRVDATRPHAVVGMSMGGMVAQEIAALTGPTKVVLISSWKGLDEMPPAIKLLRGTHPEKLLTKRFLERTMPMLQWHMGASSQDEVDLLDDLLKAHTLTQLKVQLSACMRWDGPAVVPSFVVHIHGDHDRLMPIRYIRSPVRVVGGTHLMVFSQADEVGHIVRQVLQD